jgi:hypothetical protein
MSTENKLGALATLWRAVQRLLKGAPTRSQADNDKVIGINAQPQSKPASKKRKDVLVLTRHYFNNCTRGVITFPDGYKLHTIENPWKENKQRLSCIPEGSYELRMRASPVVQRTSRGKYVEGWEVVDVPNRSYIMFHIANTAADVEGCIGVGVREGEIAGKPAVLKSRVGFNKFMNSMKGRDVWTLVIREDG